MGSHNENECAIGEEVDIDCSTKGYRSRKKFEVKQHVRIFIVELTNFIVTIARNSRFINLMSTSWHAVPKDIKSTCGNISIFLILVEGKKWVMTGVHDSWRRHK
ncbi:hypothetical protein H5410_056808 [Solanum commersonii]|uniref:Uncharacterized protein n=1 Tax=Solanum commersonii TaxID=4109 RepID=A0A9J5WMC6_SOLCO|nr:hypothetical protein H5410_056808 [Solanum commersonii]